MKLALLFSDFTDSWAYGNRLGRHPVRISRYIVENKSESERSNLRTQETVVSVWWMNSSIDGSDGASSYFSEFHGLLVYGNFFGRRPRAMKPSLFEKFKCTCT